jgi:protein-S-isoprenylcysteine O-methyltransferase Ste14
MTTIDSGAEARPTTVADQSMSTAREEATRSHNPPIEFSVRICTAVPLCLFVYAAIVHWRADPMRITLLLLIVSECLAVGLTLISRVPVRRDWTPLSVFLAISASFYFLVVRLEPGVRLVPETVGATLQAFGICWQIFAKASLRRSFGLLPANRGVVCCGAYRFMRHPMYLGYIVAETGFLLVNFGLQNLLVFGVQFAMQGGRIVREEKFLSSDANYLAYKEKVRYRIIPGLI